MKSKKDGKVQINLRGDMVITGLTDTQTEFITDVLTFDNPAYKNALLFSGYDRVRIPPYITYYEKTSCGLVVPIGYDYGWLEQEGAEVFDNRTLVPVKTPHFVLTLRDSQKEAAESYLSANQDKELSGLIQMPTGKGKSILGLYLASQLKQRTLIIVHKTDLLRGWIADAELAFNGEVKCGQYGASKKKLGDFITVATVQTLSRLSDSELEDLGFRFGFVIVDEVHHCPSSTYSLINKFMARYKLGLTATPERKDGLSGIMPVYFGRFCYEYKVTAEDEDILPVDVCIKKPNVFFNPICKRIKLGNSGFVYKLDNLYAPYDYEPKENEIRLSKIPYSQRPKLSYAEAESVIVKDPNYMKVVLKDILKEYNNGKSCIVFFRQKEHCSLYYEKLINEGVSEEKIQIYNGDCTAKQLEDCLIKAESKEVLITLTTYSKSTEGTNVKSWEVEFLVGSVNDGKTVEQAVGRIRRVDGIKKKALVYDYDLSSVPMFSQHIKSRVQRYKKLRFNFVGNKPKTRNMFGRGFNA